MGLKDLPVLPTFVEDKVRSAYVEELRKVETAQGLRDFHKRWVPLFQLRHRPIKFDKKEKDARRFRLTADKLNNVKTGNMDFDKTLACIKIMLGGGVCHHMHEFSCEGGHMVIPQVLLEAQGVAEYFGVSSDLALIQMNGGMAALYSEPSTESEESNEREDLPGEASDPEAQR